MVGSEVGTVRSVLRRLIEARAQVRERFHLLPRKGSIAAKEIMRQHEFAEVWSQEPAADCHTLAQLRILAAIDHMYALVNLLQDPDLVYSPASVARAAIECTARAWWLLDPDVDLRTRVLRGMADRLVSQGELARVPIQEVADYARGRIDRILAGAAGFNLQPVRTKKGAYRGIGEVTVPGVMELLRDQLGPRVGEVAYRELSLIAHGDPIGIVASSRVVEDPAGRHERGLFAPRVGQGTVASRIGVVTLSYTEAVDREVRLFGWDRTDWIASRDESKKAMGRLLRSIFPKEGTDPLP
jgi:hypothetical protein